MSEPNGHTTFSHEDMIRASVQLQVMEQQRNAALKEVVIQRADNAVLSDRLRRAQEEIAALKVKAAPPPEGDQADASSRPELQS